MAIHQHSESGPTQKNTDTSLTQRSQKLASPSDTESQTDVRWEKVLSLRASIACGRYNISAEAVATKLMDHMRGEAGQLARITSKKTCEIAGL